MGTEWGTERDAGSSMCPGPQAGQVRQEPSPHPLLSTADQGLEEAQRRADSTTTLFMEATWAWTQTGSGLVKK